MQICAISPLAAFLVDWTHFASSARNSSEKFKNFATRSHAVKRLRRVLCQVMRLCTPLATRVRRVVEEQLRTAVVRFRFDGAKF
mmetsp:Transcript_762/g.1362  ORF Transcript_762/g.1362 Transcript_762/m.1362 type:complete len:84 (+) Transcript_762:574-825(+)